MRKDDYTIGDYIHVYNRGNRKLPIVHDSRDKERFVKSLFYFNNESPPINPFQNKADLNNLTWLESWPARNQIVKIISFALMPNHFHLLLKEIKENGTTKFMQRIGTGITMYYNTRYNESGRLFQGAYKARYIDNDLYLRYLSVYIQVKNIFELYPGGLKKAFKEFDRAYNWAIDNKYSSLGDFIGIRDRGIIDKDTLSELFVNAEKYKDFSRDCILSMNLEQLLGDTILEV